MDAGVVYFIDSTVEIQSGEEGNQFTTQFGMLRQQVKNGVEVMESPNMIHEGVIHMPCYKVSPEVEIPGFGIVRVHIHVSKASDHIHMDTAPPQMRNGQYAVHRHDHGIVQ